MTWQVMQLWRQRRSRAVLHQRPPAHLVAWLAVWAGVGTARTVDVLAALSLLLVDFQNESASRAASCAAAESPSSRLGEVEGLRRSQPLPGLSAKKASTARATAGAGQAVEC